MLAAKKTFVAIKLCLSQQNVFVATQFCRYKRRVLSQQTRICRDKSKLVAIRLLLRQNYVCRDKYLSGQKLCRDKHSFVAK